MENKILILPDIHGRKFWHDAVEKYKDEVEKIIFLGDYLDPYGYEGVTADDAIQEFCDILEFKDNNMDKTILLLGNHDICYFNEYFRINAGGGRFDYFNAEKIKELFTDNMNMFQLAYEQKVGDTRYLFTHAGIVRGWYEFNFGVRGNLTVENLNKLLDTEEGVKALSNVGLYRWGSYDYGSMVWADVHEQQKKRLFEDVYQVFGHTQQESDPIINKRYACLDCRKAFLLTSDCEIKEAS